MVTCSPYPTVDDKKPQDGGVVSIILQYLFLVLMNTAPLNGAMERHATMFC